MSSALPPPPRRDWAFFLDVDGTLLEIAATPSEVRAEPDLVATLAALNDACGGAVALLSGRRITDLDRIFWPLRSHPQPGKKQRFGRSAGAPGRL